MRLRVLARDNNTCTYCGAHAATVDYVVPWSKGGEATWENLVACCNHCNNRQETG